MPQNQEYTETEGHQLSDISREEKALHRFKEAVAELITLFRLSIGAPTAYLYWINRQRKQFVLECSSTKLDDVVFQDRASFDDHFLLPFKDLEEAEIAEINEDFPVSRLQHHVEAAKVRSLALFPFVNNGETIALTVAETEGDEEPGAKEFEAAHAYQQALANILKTYLELSELLGEEDRWQEFQQTVESFSDRLPVQELLVRLTGETAALMQNGSAALLTRGAGSWHVLFTAGDTGKGIRPGMRMSENSQANRALRSGKAEFTLHFNGNPKRIGTGEPFFEGASLSVPLLVHDRRQAVLVTWDENAMAFRESLKYMINDLVRIAGLQLSQVRYGIGTTDDMTAGESGAYTREFLEAALDHILKKSNLNEMPVHLVFISPKDYQILRTRHRLEALKQMQRELGEDLNPNHAGLNGLVGFYADSQFLVMVQGNRDKVMEWLGEFYENVKSKAGGDNLYVDDINFYIGIHHADNPDASAYDHFQATKQMFNQSVKENRTLTQILNG